MATILQTTGLGVVKLVKRDYKLTKVVEGETVPSEMAGKQYWICASKEGRFILEDGHSCLDAIDKGILYTLSLEKQPGGVSYVTHTTTKQELEYAMTEHQIATIKLPASQVKTVANPESLVD